jgi:hypothetical protein
VGLLTAILAPHLDSLNLVVMPGQRPGMILLRLDLGLGLG